MPNNTGHLPDLERVDLKFRNGQIARNVDPKKYRWTLDAPRYPANYDWDIASWQPATKEV